MTRIVSIMCAIGVAMLSVSIFYFRRFSKEPVTREPGASEAYYGRGLALGTPGAMLLIGNGISLIIYFGLKALKWILIRR